MNLFMDPLRFAQKTVRRGLTACCTGTRGFATAMLIVAAAGQLASQTPSTQTETTQAATNQTAEASTTRVSTTPTRAPLARTFPIDEIERGQRGYGISVFAGTAPERFDVEVVGVLRDLNPGVSFVLARFQGQGLEKTGVIGGMSGSPVFIDDRLVGAVAFSWSFASEALAGITPIEQMRRLLELPVGTPDGQAAAAPLGGLGTLRQLLSREPRRQLLAEELHRLAPKLGAGYRPSAVFGIGGFDGQARELLAGALEPLGPLAPVGRTEDGASLPPLEPGSAVAGILVGGDLELAVSGTVTEVDGDEVLAFGHSFLGTGPMRLPMAKAEVVTVVPSRLSSFKLTNVGPVVGAFDQDRLAGLRGRLGLHAPTTPVRIRIRGTTSRDYRIEVADIPAMRPSLVAVSALQTLEAASRSAGAQGVDLAMRFELAGYEPLEVRQTFDGSGAAIDAAIYLLQLVGFLELNSWVDAEVESIDLEFTQSARPRAATLVSAHPARRQVRPGQTVDLFLTLRDYRGERFQHTLSVQIPAQAKKGPFYYFVGDGMSVDATRLRIEPFVPRDFEEALELLGSYHSRDDLVALGVTGPVRGLVVSGRSLPNLPASVRSIHGVARGSQDKALALQVVEEVVERFDRPIDGLVRVDLVVLERPTF